MEVQPFFVLSPLSSPSLIPHRMRQSSPEGDKRDSPAGVVLTEESLTQT